MPLVYYMDPAVIKRLSQLVFTCSKFTTETLEQVVIYFKVNNKDTRTMP